MDNPTAAYSLQDTPDTTTQDDAAYSINDNSNLSTPVTGDVAKDRARRAHIGLGDLSPGEDNLANSISVGMEGDARQSAATRLSLSKTEDNKKRVEEIARTQGAEGVAAARGLLRPVNIQPDAVFEQEFAKKFIELTAANSKNVVPQAVAENPEDTKQVLYGSAQLLAMQEVLKTVRQDAEARQANRGWGETAWNFAKGFIPTESGTVRSPDWNPENIALPGSSMEAERDKYWSFRDPAEAKKWLESRVASIESSNPLAAITYIQQMETLSSNEKWMENLFGVLDVANLGGAGKAIAGMTRRLFSSAVKGAAGDALKMENAYEAMGDLQKSGDIKSVKQLLATEDKIGVTAELQDHAPTLINPKQIVSGMNRGSLTREIADRQAQFLENQAVELVTAAIKAPRAERMTEEALNKALDVAKEGLRQQFNHAGDNIIDFRVGITPGSNTRYVEMIVGEVDGTLARSEKRVNDIMQQELGLDYLSYRTGKAKDEPGLLAGNRTNLRKGEFGYETVQHGDGWYGSVVKYIDETADPVRSMALTTKNTNPVSLGNTFMGGIFQKFRSAEDQLAYFQRSLRHIATTVPNEIQRIMSEKAQAIGVIRGERKDELNRFLSAGMKNWDPVKGERGIAYRTQATFEQAWQEMFPGKLPTQQQSLAYFTYHQLMDTDWMLRNFSAHRDLARQGAETVTAVVRKTDGSTPEVVFPGKHLPQGIDWRNKTDGGILVLHRDAPPQFYWKADAGPTNIEHLKSLQEQGWKAYQVGNPDNLPFKDVIERGSTVNFILTKDATTKPLSMKLVDYNPGSHIIYPQAHKVVQPVAAVADKGRLNYYGDKIAFFAESEKSAAAGAKALDGFRKLLREPGVTDATLQAYIDNNKMPRDLDFWKRQFDMERTGAGHLSLDHPIVHTPTGKSSLDNPATLEHSIFKDTEGRPLNLRRERNSEYNMLRSIDVDFMASRDGPVLNWTNQGSLSKPVYDLHTAEMIDPFASLSRALGNSVRTLINNDVKIAAIEQYAQQYAKIAVDPVHAAKNPFEFFYGEGNINMRTADRALLNSALNAKERITNFLGTKSQIAVDLDHWLQQQFGKLGDGAAKFYSTHELRALKDPIAFTRAVMYNLKFGMGNIKQFVIQGMGAAHAIAIAGPDAGWKGFVNYAVQRAGLHMTDDPKILDHYASIAERLGGMKKEWFKESWDAMRRSGVDIIGKEHTLRDDSFDMKLFSTIGGKILDWGAVFFKEGERLTRMTAFNAAYYEWRKANPNAPLNNYRLAEILTRTDDLAANMTKASHSKLQEGVFAPSFQFMTFSQRMLEQFWGSRLTGAEKARAFLTHSALFGVPAAAGAATFMPFADMLRKYQLENGNNIIDNKFYQAVMEGGMAYAFYLATGREYNFGERYGPGPSDQFKKWISGETGFWETVTGPTGATVMSIMKSLYPITANLHLALIGSDQRYPITWADIVPLIREVSSGNDFHNAYYAVNLGIYVNKNNQTMQKGLDALDAGAIVFGLTNRPLSDARLMMGSIKDQEEAQKKAMVKAQEQLNTAFKYLGANEDMAKFDLYVARAKVIMDAMGQLTDKQKAEVLKRATEQNKTYIDRARHDFVTKGNKNQLPARLQRLFDGKL